jgi:putative phage-type endonuclease
MIAQGSAEWHQERLGKATASKIADIIARTKTGYGAGRANYAAQLIAERLTGTPTEGFTNAAMAWGNEKEPEARELYEFVTGRFVDQIGFVPHPVIAMSGASPDGLVGADGLLEIKCPQTATHLDTLTGQAIPAKYQTQMLWQMACTGRAWCDFASYDPRMPPHMRLFIRRLERDEARIAEMEAEVSAFLAEIDARIEQLKGLYPEPQAVAA